MKIYTIGHSTRTLEELVALLRENGVERLADIRRYPGSKRYPHFSKESLSRSLPNLRSSDPRYLGSSGQPPRNSEEPEEPRNSGSGPIAYEHFEDLGGRRKPAPDSPNTGLRNEQFRAYADYMSTPEFDAAVARLVDDPRPTAYMCAEAVPWRCHRNLLSDDLLRRGLEVLHIVGPRSVKVHELSALARTVNGRLVYGPEENQGKMW